MKFDFRYQVVFAINIIIFPSTSFQQNSFSIHQFQYSSPIRNFNAQSKGIIPNTMGSSQQFRFVGLTVSFSNLEIYLVERLHSQQGRRTSTQLSNSPIEIQLASFVHSIYGRNIFPRGTNKFAI